MFVPTAGRVPPQWPLPTLPGSPGRAVTRLAWKLQEQHHGRTNFDAGINEFRASIGLQPFRGNVLHSMESPFLTLMLMSEHFFPVPSDWPEHYRTVGFPTWNSNADAALQADIDAFIAAGDAPVLVTRGTLGPVLSPDRFETIAAILDDLGVRSILTLGHGSDLTPALRDRPGVWPFVPLMSVLPRCRAVLPHAGGLGTLAAVLTCGTPSVVAPESAESRWSARRTEALGLGVGLRRRPPSATDPATGAGAGARRRRSRRPRPRSSAPCSVRSTRPSPRPTRSSASSRPSSDVAAGPPHAERRPRHRSSSGSGRRGPRGSVELRTNLALLIAAAGGIGAVFADPSATGNPVIDAILRFATAFGVAMAASRALGASRGSSRQPLRPSLRPRSVRVVRGRGRALRGDRRDGRVRLPRPGRRRGDRRCRRADPLSASGLGPTRRHGDRRPRSRWRCW